MKVGLLNDSVCGRILQLSIRPFLCLWADKQKW